MRNIAKLKVVLLVSNIIGVLLAATLVGLIALPLVNFIGYVLLAFYTGKAFR